MNLFRPEVKGFFDKATYTISYVAWDPETKDAVLIDPVMDYEPIGSTLLYHSIEEIIRFVRSNQLKIHWIIETHAHADHLSGSQPLKEALGVGVAIGEGIQEVQALFKKKLDLPESIQVDGSQFDLLLRDGQILQAGSLNVEILHTPGHTPACVSLKIGDSLFTGDSLFMHDYGTGRCDFPGGSSEQMYHSIHEKLYLLPEGTRVFVGHDYCPEGRDAKWETTIGLSKQWNPQLRQETTLEEYVRFRNQRDKSLEPPKLLFQSIQVNIDAGHLPKASAQTEVSYLKIPINIFRGFRQDGGSSPDPLLLKEEEVF